MATKTKPIVGGDLLIHWESEYCFEQGVVRNPDATAAANYANVVGAPVKLASGVWNLVDDADIANVGGLIIQGDPISALAATASTTSKYLILARGPAIVNQNKLAALDYEGDAINQANFIAALEALNVPIRCEPEPTKTTTGVS